MSTYESFKMYFSKEGNRLVVASNFLAWKKREYSILIENEAMRHVQSLNLQRKKLNHLQTT